MTNLSVNINKIATLRNARGENNPSVEDWALAIEGFGAKGITVHPRPDIPFVPSSARNSTSRAIRLPSSWIWC